MAPREFVSCLRRAGFTDAQILVIVTVGFRALRQQTIEDRAALDAWLERVGRGPESTPTAVH